jgi:hypothetical protein
MGHGLVRGSTRLGAGRGGAAMSGERVEHEKDRVMAEAISTGWKNRVSMSSLPVGTDGIAAVKRCGRGAVGW